jgi:hypothetical protein
VYGICLCLAPGGSLRKWEKPVTGNEHCIPASIFRPEPVRTLRLGFPLQHILVAGNSRMNNLIVYEEISRDSQSHRSHSYTEFIYTEFYKTTKFPLF